MSTFDSLDKPCKTCDADGSTVRVTGGSLEGAHWSVYACGSCTPRKRRIIEAHFPDSTEIVPLPGRSVTLFDLLEA